MEGATTTKFGIGLRVARGEDDTRTPNTRIAQRKSVIPHSTMKIELASHKSPTHREDERTCIVVTTLCNQPKAFASDLGDD